MPAALPRTQQQRSSLSTRTEHASHCYRALPCMLRPPTAHAQCRQAEQTAAAVFSMQQKQCGSVSKHTAACQPPLSYTAMQAAACCQAPPNAGRLSSRTAATTHATDDRTPSSSTAASCAPCCCCSQPCTRHRCRCCCCCCGASCIARADGCSRFGPHAEA